MAKKIDKVVIQENYYELLVSKAEMLDRIFDDDEVMGATIVPDDFKEYAKISEDFDKLPEGAADDVVEYHEPVADQDVK